MQISFKYPNEEKLVHFLKNKKNESYNYQELNGTKSESVEGYDNDHNKILLGQGELVWNKAKAAISSWQQFPQPWTKIYNNTTPLEEGNIVTVLFKLFGIWWLNPAKIVYAFDEENRFGFAYGTLHGHVEKGEECFWIDRDESGDIFYHIKAFSKPMFWGAKLIYPIARRYQRKFVTESMKQMKVLSNQK